MLEKTSKKKMKRNKLDEYKSKSHPRNKLLPCEEPDVSRILKITESGQIEEADESFDHPLHSTAVDADGNVELLNEEHLSAGHSSASVAEGKNAERRKKWCSLKMPEDNKSEMENSEDESPKDNERPQNRAKSHVKPRKSPQKRALDPSAADSPRSLKIWCPKGLKRFSQDITEFDVVLAEFEKITASYKQRAESRICRLAIDNFYSGFKEQLTNIITEVQELKDLKRKNAKVITHINKKRWRLLEVREELIRTGPQLKQLQREYAELQERESSLRNTTQFLTDLKEVQQHYLNYRKDNPKEKVVYGTSSIPALLVESQQILRAESHFQNISIQLQEVLKLQKQPEKF